MLGACARTTQRLVCDANFSTGSQMEAGHPSSGLTTLCTPLVGARSSLAATLLTPDPVLVNPEGPLWPQRQAVIHARFDSQPRFVPHSYAMAIGQDRSDRLPGAVMPRALQPSVAP